MDQKEMELLFYVAEQYIGRTLCNADKQYINKWIQMGFSKELIDLALEQAAIKTAGRNTMLYTNSILEHWKQEKLTTLADVKVYEQRLSEERQKQAASREKRMKAYEAKSMQITPRDPLFVKYDVADLKPCPFCGGTDVVVRNQYSSKHEAFYALVQCMICGANTRTSMNCTYANPDSKEFWESDSVMEVVKLWNTRV